jgi:outer membrane protein W
MGFARLVLAASLVCVVAPSAIAAEGSSWTLRFHGAIVESSGGGTTSFAGGAVSRIESGGGLGIGLEYRLSERFGLEFSTLLAGLEIGMRASARLGTFESFEMSVVPLTFGLPIHFDTGERVDLFIAPTLSIVHYTDIRSSVDWFGMESTVSVDNDLGIGAALGLDVPFGKGKWAFSTGLRYIKTQAEKTDVDPLIVTVGLAYRFGA